VIGLRFSWRFCLAALATVSLAAIVGLAPGRSAGLDPAHVSGDEIKALEQRLTDAGCYKGAIDGTASTALSDAIKSCPDQRPFLRIETGMHVAPIRRIGVDAACRRLATASDDKTVRIWSLPEGKLEQTIRLPIGGGVGGIYMVALAPDGRTLAAGGWPLHPGAASLYVVDLASGAVRRFGDLPGSIWSIAFSADSARVAVGLLGGKGVRAFDVATGGQTMADADYDKDVRDVLFGADGAMYSASSDGFIRRYDPSGKLEAKRGGITAWPWIALTSDGSRLAVGAYFAATVTILDARTLTTRASAETGDVRGGNFQAVAWTHDGSVLAAGGRAQSSVNGVAQFFVRRFDARGRRIGADSISAWNTIEDLRTCGTGFLFASSEPSFGLVGVDGSVRVLQSPRVADMRGKLREGFTVSDDGARVRFGLGHGDAQPVLFDLAMAELSDSAKLSVDLRAARLDGLPVEDWENHEDPTFAGASLRLATGEMSHALAIGREGGGFALGTNIRVLTFDSFGNRLRSYLGRGEVWGVTFAAADKLLVAAYSDGTIRWLRSADGVELLILFVEPQTRRWVAWTPSGYYMASAGGEDLIGWHVNRGWSQEADFFPASQFRAEYNRPDIVRLVLQTKDEAEAIRRANAVAKRAAQPIALALPPILTIASPADGSHFSGDSIKIAYSLRSPSGLPIDRLDVLADGLPIKATGFAPMKGPEATGNVIAEPPKKDAAISLIAYSGGLSSAPVGVKLVYDRPIAMAPPDPRPKLYALLIGVTGYQNPDYNNIRYSAHDADELAQALMAQKGGLYADVEAKVVDDPGRPDADPTRSNVEEGLYWLQHTATNRDLSVVFLSGHGFLDPKQKFWFLTREADIDRLRTTAISNDDLLDLIDSIPGKKILFVDACHSGAAMVVGYKATPSETTPDMNKVVNDFSTAGSGVVVFAASTGTELAKEDEKWDRHGAFAKALIEAIGEGKAAIEARKPITTDLLDYYVVERVKQLTDGKQHPVMHRPDLVPDFPLALSRH
jgi:WD40 repeat protein